MWHLVLGGGFNERVLAIDAFVLEDAFLGGFRLA